jgi:hypothetical protein
MVLWPEDGVSLPSGDVDPSEPVHVPVAVMAPTPQPRPRSYSSGLRNSDASASRPAPKPRTPVITRAALESMSRAEYNERIRDPIFRRAVDALA